jgi:hypothetical protein
MSGGQPRLGSLLVEMGFIEETQLAAALREQARSGRRLGRILIDHGAITEERLVHALSRQLGIETCDPIMTPIEPEVLALISPELASRHRVLPVARLRDERGDVVYVATSDPLDAAVQAAVRGALGGSVRLRWLLAGETELDLALVRHHRREPPQAPRRPPQGLPERAPPLPVGMPVIAGRPLSGPSGPSPRLPGEPGSERPRSSSSARPASGTSLSSLGAAPVDGLAASLAQAPSASPTFLELPPLPSDAPRDDAATASNARIDLARLRGALHDDIASAIIEAQDLLEAGIAALTPRPEDSPVLLDTPLPEVLEVSLELPPIAALNAPVSLEARVEPSRTPQPEAQPSWADLLPGAPAGAPLPATPTPSSARPSVRRSDPVLDAVRAEAQFLPTAPLELATGRERTQVASSPDRDRTTSKMRAPAGGATLDVRPPDRATLSPQGGVTLSPQGGVTLDVRPPDRATLSPQGGVTLDVRLPDRATLSPQGGVTLSPQGGVTLDVRPPDRATLVPAPAPPVFAAPPSPLAAVVLEAERLPVASLDLPRLPAHEDAARLGPTASSPDPSVTALKALSARLIAGDSIEPEGAQALLRVVVAVLLDEGLLDEARLERALKRWAR